MKQTGLILVLGLLMLTGSMFAGVDCSAIQACQTVDPNTGAAQPAVIFNLDADQTVPYNAVVWAAADCQGDPAGMYDGSVDLYAGINYLGLPVSASGADPGMVFSIQWTLDVCPQSDCMNYVVGNDTLPSCDSLINPIDPDPPVNPIPESVILQ